MKKYNVLLITLLAILLVVIGSATAWGQSLNIVTIDDYTATNTGTTSSEMGSYLPGDYALAGRTFTSLDLTGISAANLNGKDTLILWGYNPALMSASQKTDINNWLINGGKLIIWDAEDAHDDGALNTFDYSWVVHPFTIVAPGQLGARGTLWIIEDNQLGTYNPGPNQIDNASLSTGTDAVGDAAIFTATNPLDWCVHMTATNVIPATGPVSIYSKEIGTGKGIIIYSGLDWDNAANSGAGANLKKLLLFELNADTLPCSVTPIGNVVVTKDADQSSYMPGDTITFTIKVSNTGGTTIYNAALTDTPPAEITLIDPAFYNLGNIAPGAKITTTITATADTAGTGLENVATAAGDNDVGQHVYSGADKAIFDIGTPSVNAPEFPTLALPIGMIIGMVFIVYSVRKKE